MDVLDKLEKIVEYEFNKKRQRMMDYERAYERLVIRLEDVKNDDDVKDYINQMHKNNSFNSMQKTGMILCDVREYKKRKLEETEKQKDTKTDP